jgi:hypothetical protein
MCAESFASNHEIPHVHVKLLTTIHDCLNHGILRAGALAKASAGNRDLATQGPETCTLFASFKSGVPPGIQDVKSRSSRCWVSGRKCVLHGSRRNLTVFESFLSILTKWSLTYGQIRATIEIWES